MKASFTKMSESTAEDWQIIMPEQIAFFKKLPDRILSHMELLTGDYGGFALIACSTHYRPHTEPQKPVKTMNILSVPCYMILVTLWVALIMPM